MPRFFNILPALPFILLPVDAAVAQDQAEEELNLILGVFEIVQPRSIKENREFCGYIGFDRKGELVSTRPVPGGKDDCTPILDPRMVDFVASWHTHAAYDQGAWSEVPSVNDIEADEEEGVDGYVATPGGRVWYVDTTDMVVSQLCGLGCVTADPGFVPGSEGVIEESYTYEELLEREGQ